MCCYNCSGDDCGCNCNLCTGCKACWPSGDDYADMPALVPAPVTQ